MLGIEIPGEAVADIFLCLGIPRFVHGGYKIGGASRKVGQEPVQLVVIGPVPGGLLDGFPCAVHIAIQNECIGLLRRHLSFLDFLQGCEPVSKKWTGLGKGD